MKTDSVYCLNPQIRMQWEEVQGCYVLLYPEGMVKLGASSGEILKAVDGKQTAQKIADELAARFDDPDVVEDVIEFIAEAVRQGWLHAKI